MVEEDGVHPLGSGDAACWPAGATSAHKVVNRPNASCTYPSLGIRAARDVVHYPDAGRVGYIEGGAWRLHRTDNGVVIVEGGGERDHPLTW